MSIKSTKDVMNNYVSALSFELIEVLAPKSFVLFSPIFSHGAANGILVFSVKILKKKNLRYFNDRGARAEKS